MNLLFSILIQAPISIPQPESIPVVQIYRDMIKGKEPEIIYYEEESRNKYF